MEEHTTIVSLHEDDEYEMPRYDVLSDLYKDHIALQPLEIPSTSYHGSDFATYSKVGWYFENEICVVDPCIRKTILCVSHWKEKIWCMIFFSVDD